MANQERVFIVVDGSNLYHRLKETLKDTKPREGLLTFNYNKFSRWLAEDSRIIQKKFYSGVVRVRSSSQKARKLRSDQQKLFTKLSQGSWLLGYGFILQTGNKYHEKGVDVLMAVDILVGAYEDLYDKVILVSSDTDLIPALAKVRSMDKKVEYVGFSHNPSFALITHSDTRRLMTLSDSRKFFT